MRTELFFAPGRDFPVLLAPMAGVTDGVYRSICRAHGADLTYTEMASAKGLWHGGRNTARLIEPPPDGSAYGVQLFGNDPNIISDIVKALCVEAEGLALIDLNMGCPAHKIVSNNEGAALMRDLPLAAKLIEAAVGVSRVPVTVKFRKGYDALHVNAVEFARMAEDSGAAMVTVHGRTREEMYAGKADWDIIARVKGALQIPVIGNGDILSGADALQMRAETGCDGVMVARGAEGNPFIFEEIKAALSGAAYVPPTALERVDAAILHTKLHAAAKGPRAFVEMRKHIAWYVKGMRDAAAFRVRVNAAAGYEGLVALLEGYRRFLSEG